MFRVSRSYRSTRESLKEREMLWEHKPQLFRVLPNFLECFYLTIRLFSEVIVDWASSLNLFRASVKKSYRDISEMLR